MLSLEDVAAVDMLWRKMLAGKVRHFLPPSFPSVICLIGSTRFKAAYVEANYRETMAGKIVLSVGWFSHADATVYTPTEAEKQALDRLHMDKVWLADEVLVINVGGYIGSSTRNELAYARALGKPVRFLEPPREDA